MRAPILAGDFEEALLGLSRMSEDIADGCRHEKIFDYLEKRVKVDVVARRRAIEMVDVLQLPASSHLLTDSERLIRTRSSHIIRRLLAHPHPPSLVPNSDPTFGEHVVWDSQKGVDWTSRFCRNVLVPRIAANGPDDMLSIKVALGAVEAVAGDMGERNARRMVAIVMMAFGEVMGDCVHVELAEDDWYDGLVLALRSKIRYGLDADRKKVGAQVITWVGKFLLSLRRSGPIGLLGTDPSFLQDVKLLEMCLAVVKTSTFTNVNGLMHAWIDVAGKTSYACMPGQRSWEKTGIAMSDEKAVVGDDYRSLLRTTAGWDHLVSLNLDAAHVSTILNISTTDRAPVCRRLAIHSTTRLLCEGAEGCAASIVSRILLKVVDRKEREWLALIARDPDTDVRLEALRLAAAVRSGCVVKGAGPEEARTLREWADGVVDMMVWKPENIPDIRDVINR
ncbi:hypothetical protein HK101_002157 [Irineochytrium annulatum]|nr:hypothetical protein HK101_002157 [Irineochytrium annulatum]